MTGINWPTGWGRTPPQERERTHKFEAGMGQTTKELARELDRMDVDEWRASTGSGGAYTKSNGMPKYDANPDDPGFVLRWVDGDEQYAVACDHYTDLSANVRAVYLWLNETRMRSNRPVQTGESAFAAARLPSGDDEETIVAGGEITPAHELLGVPQDASPDQIKAAYRDQLTEKHPDQGGSKEAFKRLKQAYETMMDRNTPSQTTL
jgi:DnaJ-domain-containing protein 1